MNPATRALTPSGLVPPVRPLTGMYCGWGAVAATNSFETTHGVTIDLSHEFGDQTRWDWFASEWGTNFDEWAGWVGQKTGRRFSYSCPLLTVNGDVNMGSPDGKTVAQKYVTLAAGGYNQHFTTLGQAFQSRPALRNAIVRLGWEFNGNSRAWGIPPNDAATLANYKTGFNQAAAALKAACPTLRIEWGPNCQLDWTGRSFDDMWPGGQHIDIIGIGAYDYYWPANSSDDETRWAWLRDGETGVNGLAHQVRMARRHRKHLGHTEWGLWDDTGAANPGGVGDHPWFITRITRWHRIHGYAYQIYNNVVTGEGEHTLTAYPTSLARYKTAMNNTGIPPYA